MKALFLSADAEKQFHSATELTEIRDTSGRVLGFYAPPSIRFAAGLAEAAAKVDRKELERRKKSGKPGVPTAVVLERLKRLA